MITRLQFEEAAVLVIQNLHGVNEDGSTPHFTVQVLMNSTQQFGPSSMRELSVRLSPLKLCSSLTVSATQSGVIARPETTNLSRFVCNGKADTPA